MTTTETTPSQDGAGDGATRIPLKGIQRVAARRMTEAWAAPVFHVAIEVDMTLVLTIGRRVPGATVTDALLLACARALKANPALNAHYADNVITTYSSVNLGVAVATDAGLTVPVIHGVERLTLSEIGERRKDIVSRARDGKLVRSDIEGATFTISNLGMFGVDYFDAILNPPQVAILAIGATKRRMVVGDVGPEVRPIAQMSLTCDHRAVDGTAGARLLAALRDELAREGESSGA